MQRLAGERIRGGGRGCGGGKRKHRQVFFIIII